MPGDIQNIHGLPNAAAKAHFALRLGLPRIIYCAPDEEAVSEFLLSARALRGLSGGADFSSVQIGEEVLSRCAALGALCAAGDGPVIAGASFASLLLPADDLAAFAAASRSIRRGGALKRAELLDWLEKSGYQRAEFAEQPGEYAARGAVADIFAPGAPKPARLYLSGDGVESIRFFDPETQDCGAFADAIALPPCRAASGETPLLQRLSGFRFITDLTEPAHEAVPAPEIPGAIAITPLSGENYGAGKNLSFSGNVELLVSEVARLRAGGINPVVSCLNRGELERIGELAPGLDLRVCALREGFVHPPSGFAVITSGDIFSRRYSGGSLLKKFDSPGSKRVRFRDLKPGDFVVHETYGIGRYLGMSALRHDGTPASPDDTDAADCLRLEYKNSHRLFVPLFDFSKVQKYVGAEGKAPRLSALGGNGWGNIKSRVKEGVEKAAKEILAMEAERAAAQSPALPGDEHMEREFADSFPYEETPDQTKAIAAVAAQLSLPKPMDAVIAGDVGFGKTEVAIRAALRCVLSGRQAAVVVPTTVLAAQHFRTFTQRLAGFPVKTAMLCRFQSTAEQKQTVLDLRSGACDIIIGTQRLLSKDVAFARLGLCIIDEEHRFGVRQKEKIRRISAGAHTLLMSATPIPRTLYQAMSGLREIAVIETPPAGRMPIATRVAPWDEKIAAAAIREELARGGQVYYVHNRVRTLASRAAFLKSAVPEAAIISAHGQMPGGELERAMWDFFNRRYNVLAASTIIESGLDMPDVNTLIVENAHEFGLAQLYQLRGRIGRGDKKAYCYLFYPPWLDKKPPPPDLPDDEYEPPRRRRRHKAPPRPAMTEDAAKRLAALTEFGELGSGFRLAMRDLEIRGAGELLGLRQHGFINEVGLSLYCELLAAEVKRLRGAPEEAAPLAYFDAPVAAYIPPDYLPDEAARLDWYRRLLGADENSAPGVLSGLEGLCGPAPESVRNIAEIMKLRRAAARAGARALEMRDGALEVYFRKDSPPSAEAARRLAARYGARLRFVPASLGDGVRIECPDATPLAFAREVVSAIASNK
ncbi:MAG: DEAD/DEAH box helicase [Elusimicrobiales bacterium]